MTIHTVTSREFNQDVSAAMKAAQDEPVFVTDRGKPTHHVLLNMVEYLRLTKKGPSIVELLRMHATADIEFETTKATIELKPADFSGWSLSQ